MKGKKWKAILAAVIILGMLPANVAASVNELCACFFQQGIQFIFLLFGKFFRKRHFQFGRKRMPLPLQFLQL